VKHAEHIDVKAMLHEAIFAATCNAILDTEPCYLKSSLKEIVSMKYQRNGMKNVGRINRSRRPCSQLVPCDCFLDNIALCQKLRCIKLQ
jgi:hypothetical protein